jgi:tripartite-type tricarboxylate transporter receptor subunit TctC
VSFAPGAPPAVIGRPLLQKRSEALGQPFVLTTVRAPAGTSRERLARLQSEISRNVRTIDLRARIGEAGLRAIDSNIKEFTALIKRDFALFEKAIRAARIKPQ